MYVYLLNCKTMNTIINDVLGKSFMVAFIIAMTLYNRIAGIVALIFVIALLNRTPTKEGLTFAAPTPAPIYFNSPDEFRQKYCLKGVSDPATPSTPLEYSYMLSPTMFTDISGNIQARPEFAKFVNFATFNAGNGCTLDPTNKNKNYVTIPNMCDPTCNWATNSNSITAPSTAPSTAPITAMPTTDPAIPSLPPNDDTNTTEGFNPMSALRPHIRTGRHILTDGAANVKSFANRLKRQLF